MNEPGPETGTGEATGSDGDASNGSDGDASNGSDGDASDRGAVLVVLWRMSRPAQLALIALVYALGVAMAAGRGAATDPTEVALGLAALLPVAASVHYANEYADVETDRVFSHRAFAERHDIDFPLLSDSDGTVAESYGVLRSELLGHRRIAKRALFLLDSAGTVRYRWVGEDPETVPELTPLYEALGDLSEA